MQSQDNVSRGETVVDNDSRRYAGWFLGAVAVLIFSFTLPANAWAVQGMSPLAATVMRTALPGVCAVLILSVTRAPRPGRREWPTLVAAGVAAAVGFPLLSSIALLTIDPARAAVILGLLPALTALFACVLGRERLPWPFWLTTGAGMVVLIGYLMSREGAGGAGIGGGDLAMLAATCCSALSYVWGAERAKVLGGPQSMCWMLVALLPLSVPAAAATFIVQDVDWTLEVATGSLYLALVATLGGYFTWFAGLARGGIARVGQVQQLQPLLTIGWSALLFAGVVDPLTFVVGGVIAMLVGIGQRIRFQPATDAEPRVQRGRDHAPRTLRDAASLDSP
jgi:drug/metabolite transporter (DMT)-like permease